MPRDGTSTRTAILDAAEVLTLERGFAGAPVDRIIGAAGVTKGAFFHHFASKQDLADALIRRWALGDAHHLEDKLTRAERLVEDPLRQLELFVGFFVEEAEESAGELPGCLFAAYAYQAGLFEAGTLEVLAEAMLAWRRRLRAKLDEVAQTRRPAPGIDLDALADAVTVIFEGAFVVSRAVGDAAVVASQLRLFRTQLVLSFSEFGLAAPPR
jgi:TetR/AcrR family transcriptional repressor of nem operon